jgi:formylmethanofuran dehydrogenase subunit D
LAFFIYAGVRSRHAVSAILSEVFVGSVSGLLITVRTARQGTEMVCGKSNPKYLEEISTVRLNPEDLAELDLASDQQAVLTSAHGQAVVTCRSAEGPRGLFFMPLGEIANRLFSAACTNGIGVPDWKGLKVTLSRLEGQCGHQAQNEGQRDEYSQ